MSVDKKYVIAKKQSNFSMIPNKLSQSLNYNLEALGLYVYLFSLPPDWEFYKSHLTQVCNIGIKKLNKLLVILKRHDLVEIDQIRNDKGQFCHFSLTVKDGSSFKNIEITKQDTKKAGQSCPDGQNCRTAETVATVKRTYKEDTNKDYKKDTKSFYKIENKKKHEFAEKMHKRPNEPYSAVNKQEFFEASQEFVQKYHTSSHDRSKNIGSKSHGSEAPNRTAKDRTEISGNNVRGNGVRKVEGYLPH